MPDEHPFDDLMARLRAGDAEVAQMIFQRYSRRLVGLAMRRLPKWVRSKEDPEDAVQSALRSFFTRQAGGEFEVKNWESLWSLLTVITARKCGHRLKRFRTASRDVFRETSPPTEESGLNWDQAAPEPSPLEAAQLNETVEQILNAVKERDRPIIQLRLQGFAVAEISQQAGCSERRVFRVLERVRQYLEGLTDDGSESGEQRKD